MYIPNGFNYINPFYDISILKKKLQGFEKNYKRAHEQNLCSFIAMHVFQKHERA